MRGAQNYVMTHAELTDLYQSTCKDKLAVTAPILGKGRPTCAPVAGLRSFLDSVSISSAAWTQARCRRKINTRRSFRMTGERQLGLMSFAPARAGDRYPSPPRGFQL
jgi:hypothetical protein